MSVPEKSRPGLLHRLRAKRAARRQRSAERARLAAENPVARNAQHHAYDKGPPFGGPGA